VWALFVTLQISRLSIGYAISCHVFLSILIATCVNSVSEMIQMSDFLCINKIFLNSNSKNRDEISGLENLRFRTFLTS